MKSTRRHTSLTLKMNLLIVAAILLVSAGLVFGTYQVYCQKIESLYDERIADALRADHLSVLPVYSSYFWSVINTDEFREVRQRAVEADDPAILADWMRSKPSVKSVIKQVTHSDDSYIHFPEYQSLSETMNYLEAIYMPPNVFRPADGEEEPPPSLYEDYDIVYTILGLVQDMYQVKALYIQYEDPFEGTLYNLADPNEGILYIGSMEEPLEEFAMYKGNVAAPPTTYHMDSYWLRTACVPILTPSGREGGTLAVDIDMNEVIASRFRFLHKSVVFIIAITAAVIAASVFMMHRIATQPLKKLAAAATEFGRNDTGYTKEDVLKLDIQSNDEIGDLGREIRSMQNRIVDYTEHLAQITAERERAETEMQMAERIQLSMLPCNFPAFPDRTEFNLYASMDPARVVGGDFYDFFMVDDNHLALLIADVSDKGVPAALFMMACKLLINYRSCEGGTPAEILTAVNERICSDSKTEMFVTVWLGILEVDTGRLICTNAGHEYPAIRGEDGIFRLLHDKHGLVIGGMKDAKYRDYELELAPGDAIFVYTDGVTDANSPEGEFYGTGRMLDALNRVSGEPPEGILNGVKADIAAFVRDADPFDDLTMLCLEYKGPSPSKEK